jgi:hypothetical protein
MRKLRWPLGFLVVALLALRQSAPSPAVPAPPTDPWPGEYTLINPSSGGGIAGFGGGQLGQVGGLGQQFGIMGGNPAGFGGNWPPSSINIVKERTDYRLDGGAMTFHLTQARAGELVRQGGEDKFHLGTLRFPSGTIPDRPVLLWQGRYYFGEARPVRW